jgi:hypothetical protein
MRWGWLSFLVPDEILIPLGVLVAGFVLMFGQRRAALTMLLGLGCLAVLSPILGPLVEELVAGIPWWIIVIIGLGAAFWILGEVGAAFPCGAERRWKRCGRSQGWFW